LKIRIFQHHTHDGKTFPAGSEVDLPEDAVEYLLNAETERRAELVPGIVEADADQ
jgi:hypothetical protein